jgi:multicomponent Na+:H+ antiporter subunit A
LAYDGFLHGALGGAGDVLVLVALVGGSALTFAYSARFLWGAFARKTVGPGAELVGEHVRAPSRAFAAPVVVLAGFILALGLVPVLADGLVVDGARALDDAVSPAHLALWHGPSSALLLSLVTVAVGTVLVSQRARVERLQAAAPSPPGSDAGYRASIDGLNRIADRVTGIVQNGSLPTYMAVIAATVLALPGVALATRGAWPARIELAESPLQAVVVGILVAAALATAIVRRRFVAALLVGAVGYSMATLFVIQGGPDLALTQLLVETLTVVVFVLVLRHLPERFPRQQWRTVNVGRALIALGVGSFVTVFTIVAGAARREAPVSEGLVERAVPRGGGRNVVNVILTDFRALDTLGEISVLAVAALGITSLLFAGRRVGTSGRRGAHR